MAFRRGVYASRDVLTPGCQVLLLRLSDGMNANAIVSIPRSKLADEFGCPHQRITEWVRQAKAAGYLDTVRRGRPGVTAVYQGMRGDMARESVPSDMARESRPREARESVPRSGPQRHARAVPQEGVQAAGIETRRESPLSQRGSNEEPCRWHGFDACPADCADHPHTREEIA